MVSVLPSTANDLQSDVRSVISPSSGVIRAGGAVRAVNPGDLLTPAELSALQQVSTGGRQTLMLNTAGRATGGSVVLNAIGGNALVIPRNVTALANFSTVNAFHVDGSLTNFGSLFAYTTQSANDSGSLFAHSIVNQLGGLISTAVPRSLVPQALSNHFDLSLVARDSIVNFGTISTSGSVVLFSESGNVTNAGLISSAAGNIVFEAGAGRNLVIKGTGGILESLAGSINLRAPLAAVEANLGTVKGLVNLKAKDAHVFASTHNLSLGLLDLTGDPTFYNATGSISITSFASTPNVPLAIIASQDVVISGGSISTSGASAGDILIVAGANFSDPGAGNPLVLSDVNTGSATGGAIRVSGMNAISAKGSSGSGGNITLIAFDGSGAGSTFDPGSIVVPSLETGGTGPSATGGDVLVIAGANSGTAVELGSVMTAGSSRAAAGSITIAVAEPTILNGPVTVNPDGSIAVGSGTFAPGASASGGIQALSLNSSGAGGLPGGPLDGANASPILVTARGDITVRDLLAFGGGGAGSMLPTGSGFQKAGSGGAGADITVSSGGLLNLLGYTSSSGGGGGGGSGLFANTGGNGGNAGRITLYGDAGVEVDRDIMAVGGGGGGNGGDAGNGSDISILSRNGFVDVHALVNNSGGGGGSAFAGTTTGGAGGAAGSLISIRAWTYAWLDAPVLSAGGGAGHSGGGGSFGGGGGGGGAAGILGRGGGGGGGIGSGGNGDTLGGYGGGGSFGGGGGGGGIVNGGTGGGGGGIAGGGGAWSVLNGAGAGGSGTGGGLGGAHGISLDDGGYFGTGGGPQTTSSGSNVTIIPRYANRIVSNGGWGSGVFGGTIGGYYVDQGGSGNGTFGDGGNGGAGGVNGEGVTEVGAGRIVVSGYDIIAPRGYIALLENMHPRTIDPKNPSSSLRIAGAFNSSSNWSTSLYGNIEIIVPLPTTRLVGAGSYRGTMVKIVDPKCCSLDSPPSPPPPPPPDPSGPDPVPGVSRSNRPLTPPGLAMAAANRPLTAPALPEIILAANNPSITILPTDVTGPDVTGEEPTNKVTVPHDQSTGVDVDIITPGLGTTTIEKGWVLVVPSDATSIKTPLADVQVVAGAVVLLHVQNNRVSVFVMSDTKDGDVTVSSGTHQISVAVGQQVTISKNGDATIGNGNAPPGQIALRNVRDVDLGDGTATLSDFSIPAALANGHLYAKLSRSSDPADQALLAQLMKSAASVQTSTAHKGPYR